MKYFNEKSEIIENKQIAPSIYLLKVKSPQISDASEPGQFVNIQCSDGLEILLRRPISICENDKSLGFVTLAFQVKGKGTKILSNLSVGRTIEILGPLGQGFGILKEPKRIAVVGGGIGTFPLLYLLQESIGERHAFLGFKNKDFVVLENEFAQSCESLKLTTDDGSYGLHCLVTVPLKEQLEAGLDIVYACGPEPMLRQVVKLCTEYKVTCEVSMEQRMACGIGACFVCACKAKSDHPDGWDYKQVCRNGPVFNASKLIWGEKL